MATLIIGEVEEFGTTREHTSTDWQVAKDPDFTDLVLNVEKDTVNLKMLRAPLKNSDGSYYYPYYGSYARARVWFDEFASGWFNINIEACPAGEVEQQN